MPEPTFTRTTGQPLFLLPLNGMPAGYGIAFLPAADPAGDALTLTATWSTNPGIYLFLGAAIADQDAFVSAVRTYVGARTVRFLWIVNPADSVSAWQANEIALDPVTRSVLPAAQIGFRNFLLSIGAGCTTALNAAADALVMTAASGATITWLTNFGGGSIAAGTSVTVSFGAAAGTLAFTLAVAQADMEQLDAGCRYFFPDAASPVPDAITSVPYPVIALGAATITLYASLDPINPIDPARSVFYFLAPSGGSGSALVSGYRTVYGETMTLTPVTSALWPNGPGLVFAVKPSLDRPGPSDPYYTTFEGPFTLAVQASTSSAPANASSVARMMCGYSGIEYAGLPAASTNQLAFVSGQPAFAPVLRHTDIVSDLDVVTDAPPLTPQATTAWCALSTAGGTPLSYYAQPHDSVLYQATDTAIATPAPTATPAATTTPEAFLYYLEVFAGTYPAAARTNAVPLAPYGLLDPVRATRGAELETQVVAPYRRNLLASILTPTESGPTTGDRRAATPQGLLLSLSDNLAYWKRLTLGQTNHGAQQLQLASITGGLKSALQSNQLFAVVSNWQEFTRCCTAVPPFKLTVSDWTFDLSPATWAAHQTIVIFKYAAGTTIDELSADTGAWAWPDAARGYSDTSGNLATTQADLRDFFARAKADSVSRAELRPFVNAITNPAWNGILFLRAPLATTNFPDQLRGIAAGIDPARLYAHHVGVSVAPVHNVNQQLTQEDASVFGLIDYQDPVDLADTGVDYAFKVLGLTVLFENSTMTSFSSRIELLINRLFGSTTSQQGAQTHGNNIILDGFYQSAGGAAAYVFVTSQVSVYNILGGTLDSIDITRAQFITLSPASSTQATVETRFVIDGRLRFQQLSDFDLFSFGALKTPEGDLIRDGYLFLSNLLIEMTFPAAQPEQTAFRFNAGALAFDLSQSAARPDSLFAHFPLQVTGLLQASPKSTPRDNGFTPVGSPLSNSELTDPWFALTFNLALGTVGALAGALDIVVTLGAAWSNSDTASRTFVGLRLPGSSGGSSAAALLLQGVIGLTTRAIEFTVNRSAQGIDYILRFRGMALRLFTLTFPPGQTDLYIFGDPSGGQSGTLTWYAAYAKKDDARKDGKAAATSSLLGRRKPALRALQAATSEPARGGLTSRRTVPEGTRVRKTSRTSKPGKNRRPR
jgi:hypothetical protein